MENESFLLDDTFKLINHFVSNEMGTIDSTNYLYDNNGLPLLRKRGSRTVIIYRIREAKPRQFHIQGWDVTGLWVHLAEDRSCEDSEEDRVASVLRILDRRLYSFFLQWFVFYNHGQLVAEEFLELATDGRTIQHRIRESFPTLLSNGLETFVFGPGEEVKRVELAASDQCRA